MMQKISNKKVKKIYKKLLTFVSKFLWKFFIYIKKDIKLYQKQLKKAKN